MIYLSVKRGVVRLTGSDRLENFRILNSKTVQLSLQDRIFDVIDLNAEIEKARNTLEQADIIFQRHATKFDNTENYDDMRLKKFPNLEALPEKPAPKTIKFVKIPNVNIEPCMPQPVKPRQDKVNLSIEPNEIADPLNAITLLPLKRKFSNKKKSVSF